MIDTAGTICEAVRTLNNAGAKSVTLVATHGLLSGPAVERLRNCGAKEIVLTDTVPVPEEKRLPNMTVLSVAPLLAAGIRSVFVPHPTSVGCGTPRIKREKRNLASVR